MSVKLEFPDEYMNILRSYAEQNNVTVETALADTLEFLELKNEEFDHYQVTIEDPRQYLNDADDMSAKAIRQAFMDLFGEDSVGDTIYCYYNPDKMDVLLMDILTYGEEFYAAIKRSTNGGGENSPKLDGQDDYYDMFLAELRNMN